jgi:hypothetical protein
MDTDPLDRCRHFYARAFPDLKEGVNFHFTSPIDVNYNCLSWALSCNTQLFDSARGGTWPWIDIPGDTAEGWALFCQRHGFSVVEDKNLSFVKGIEKIAIMEDDLYLHATRQDRNGIWKSKMGDQGPDIDHVDLDCIRKGYGEVVYVLQRERDDWRKD